MKSTVYYKAKDRTRHINFIMADKFNEFAIRKEAKRVVADRFPEVAGKIVRIEWSYE